MARRPHRLRGRRKSQNWRYFVPVLLIVGVVVAFKYGPFGSDETPNDANATIPEPQKTEQKEKELQLL